MRYHNPRLSLPPAAVGSRAGSRPQFPYLSTTAGQRERLSPALLLPKPSLVQESRDSRALREAEGGQPRLTSEAGRPGAANGRALRPDGRLRGSGRPRQGRKTGNLASAARPRTLTRLGRRTPPQPRLKNRRPRPARRPTPTTRVFTSVARAPAQPNLLPGPAPTCPASEPPAGREERRRRG